MDAPGTGQRASRQADRQTGRQSSIHCVNCGRYHLSVALPSAHRPPVARHLPAAVPPVVASAILRSLAGSGEERWLRRSIDLPFNRSLPLARRETFKDAVGRRPVNERAAGQLRQLLSLLKCSDRIAREDRSRQGLRKGESLCTRGTAGVRADGLKTGASKQHLIGTIVVF